MFLNIYNEFLYCTVTIALVACFNLPGWTMLSEKSKTKTMSLFFLLTVFSSNLGILGICSKNPWFFFFGQSVVLKKKNRSTSKISLNCSKHLIRISGS